MAPTDEIPDGPTEDDALATTLAVRAGMRALQEGHATTALAHFDEALLLDPESVEAAYRRALALVGVGRYDEAMAAARLALAGDAGYEPAQALILRLERRAAGTVVEGQWVVGDVVE